uniref:Mediator of RNA polymerase II transcription subunit 9 n=1 Tax=Mesocestoides corti TaxID=53468 RepID=A0A5K3EK10_MESCO
MTMDGRPPPLTTIGGDHPNGSGGSGNITPPETFNFDLSDLIDDLLALAYVDTASSSGPEGSSGVIMSTLAQRIVAIRAAVQEAKEVCRSGPRVLRSGAPLTPRGKGSDNHQLLALFQSACELDPASQRNLLSSLGTACIAKRQLLADLNQQLLALTQQNDHFSI